jgi:hypothetical protein
MDIAWKYAVYDWSTVFSLCVEPEVGLAQGPSSVKERYAQQDSNKRTIVAGKQLTKPRWLAERIR